MIKFLLLLALISCGPGNHGGKSPMTSTFGQPLSDTYELNAATMAQIVKACQALEKRQADLFFKIGSTNTFQVDTVNCENSDTSNKIIGTIEQSGDHYRYLASVPTGSRFVADIPTVTLSPFSSFCTKSGDTYTVSSTVTSGTTRYQIGYVSPFVVIGQGIKTDDKFIMKKSDSYEIDLSTGTTKSIKSQTECSTSSIKNTLIQKML